MLNIISGITSIYGCKRDMFQEAFRTYPHGKFTDKTITILCKNGFEDPGTLCVLRKQTDEIDELKNQLDSIHQRLFLKNFLDGHFCTDIGISLLLFIFNL